QDGKGYGASYSTEAAAILEKEGPKYQYGTGCLSDGVLGCWIALACGVGQVLDTDKVRSHLRAVHRHNFKADLFTHANPQRPTYANGHEGGLLLCSWPRGDMLSLPFVYSNEVWTGIEYQAASHMILMGLVDEGLEIVRACRARYDGRVRNPFDEYEWGHWYARAMASYGLLQALSGARYDAVEGILHLEPAVRGDFRCFLSTATGYGTVGVSDGRPFLKVVSGAIPVRDIRFKAAPGQIS
ncbi:MAG TPA: GH116 family glycosyl hydrolase, partial [Opitutaceae bacterium]